MDTPFEGVTTRSRSQNQDTTQTARGNTDPESRPAGDQWVADSQHQEAQLVSDDDDGPDLTDPPSDEEDPQGPSPPTGPAADLEERLEEGKRAVALLEQRVQEARDQKRLAVEVRIAELGTQERRRKALEKELHELLRQDGGDSWTNGRHTTLTTSPASEPRRRRIDQESRVRLRASATYPRLTGRTSGKPRPSSRALIVDYAWTPAPATPRTKTRSTSASCPSRPARRRSGSATSDGRD